MRYGSLFSGAGLGDFGFDLAGLECAWQVEIDDYCQKILNLRWPNVRKFRDIKTLDPKDLEEVDLITGGFPCQPFSVAGKRRGKEDNRNLWPKMLRIIKVKKPAWVVGENVPGIINMALDDICADLEGEGYEVWPVVFPSHALGAWHKRDRLWIIAYSRFIRRQGLQQLSICLEENRSWEAGMARTIDKLFDGSSQWKTWNIEPFLLGETHGVSNRMDRLKALGNGQTPCSTYVIGKWIMEVEERSE